MSHEIRVNHKGDAEGYLDGQLVCLVKNSGHLSPVILTRQLLRVISGEGISLLWTVDDLKQRLVDLYRREINALTISDEERALYPFDETQARFALTAMKGNHDANNGITWDTIDHYLQEFGFINHFERWLETMQEGGTQ